MTGLAEPSLIVRGDLLGRHVVSFVGMTVSDVGMPCDPAERGDQRGGYVAAAGRSK